MYWSISSIKLGACWPVIKYVTLLFVLNYVWYTGPNVLFPLARHKIIGYAHDISCPLHISSKHDISLFLPRAMWSIELNPLHIMDEGRMVFLVSVLNMTQEISCYRICVVQVHDMYSRYTADPALTATPLFCLYLHTYTIYKTI